MCSSHAVMCSHAILFSQQVPASSIVEWTHSRIIFQAGPGEGARVLSVSAFGQQPTLERTVADIVYKGPVLAGNKGVTAIDGSFSTDGGDRAMLSGTFLPLPDIRSQFGSASIMKSRVINFPLALPIAPGVDLPMCALRINFGALCITGASDPTGKVPQSVAACSAAAPVTLIPQQSWYSGVTFLQSNAANVSAAAMLLNLTGDINATMLTATSAFLSYPFLTVALPLSTSDSLVFFTPPGVGAGINVSLSILDDKNHELWRSNVVRDSLEVVQIINNFTPLALSIFCDPCYCPRSSIFRTIRPASLPRYPRHFSSPRLAVRPRRGRP